MFKQLQYICKLKALSKVQDYIVHEIVHWIFRQHQFILRKINSDHSVKYLDKFYCAEALHSETQFILLGTTSILLAKDT